MYRDERKRKAGKSRVKSFSRRDASLMNNLSAREGKVREKVMEGTEKVIKHKKREETTTNRSHDAAHSL